MRPRLHRRWRDPRRTHRATRHKRYDEAAGVHDLGSSATRTPCEHSARGRRVDSTQIELGTISRPHSRSVGPYQLFIAALSVVALLILGLEAATTNEQAREVLGALDTFVCFVFLIDFGLTLRREPRPWRYMVTWGWIDLLSSIPAVSFLRLGRAARIARILRIFRGLRATRTLSKVLIERRSESTALAAFLLGLLLVAFASIAVLHVEEGVAGANILTGDDALWWSITTLTTVGYGDKFPVSSEGRAVAMILMAAGVGLFGTFSATLAAWFINSREDEGSQEIKRLIEEVRALRLVVTQNQAASPAILAERPGCERTA
jgi:voltage-gated potassium channel